MKPLKKSSNTQPSRMLSQGRRRYYSISVPVVLVALVCLAAIPSAIADSSYTVDDIADGLLAAEAQLTDLRVEYVFTHRAWDKPAGPSLVGECIYAQKKIAEQNIPTVLRYLDQRFSIVDPNKEHSTLTEDTLASFDGQATTILYRKERQAEPNKPMKGYILSGYQGEFFGGPFVDPHTKIWYYGNKKISDILKDNKNTFRIESKSEVLNGIPTVKLAGTIADGKITMKLWVSPEHNFLPMKRQIMETGGRLHSETELYNLVKLSSGLWYPKMIRSPAEPPGAPDPAYVHTYNISEISIEPIPKEFFTPEFPANTRVHDEILDAEYTTYYKSSQNPPK